jgi:catechol 2,3-dioxygenase-like lactoylglutathione lyase family enzyme
VTADDLDLAVTGIGHVALTVTDLDVSERFYTEVLGLMTLFDFGTGRLLLNRRTGFTLGLLAHEGGRGEPFTHVTTGLDHLGFPVDTRAELVSWQSRLQRLGVTYTPIRDMELGYHLNFRDPDNIALELSAPNEVMRDAVSLLHSGQFSPAEIRQVAAQRFGDLRAFVVRDR